jgi:hypothetical protein
MFQVKGGRLVTVALIGLVVAAASADQVFDDEGLFLAAAGAVLIEDVEDEALVGTPDGGGVNSIAVDDFVARSIGGDGMKILGEEWYGNQNHTPGGLKYLSVDSDQAGVSFDSVLTFDYRIVDFGVWFNDIESGGSVLVNGTTYPVAASGDGGFTFFGIVSDSPIETITLDAGDGDSHWSFDDIYYSVPEPTGLLLIGLGALALRRR